MPPPLPDRYRLEVRLERDEDVEQWLGTDLSLDRPVLLRMLGPETEPVRRHRFLAAVRAASSINHAHLVQLFTADEVVDGAYAVSEWPGGSTLADRLASGETMAVDDFLPSAAGLASALAALHSNGIVHGAIDTSAITYSLAHPAKLGGLGRMPRVATVADDVRALVSTLEEGLTGYKPGGPAPSEIVDGIHPRVDDILDRGWKGLLTAQALSEELTAAPSIPKRRIDSPSWSRRLLLAAGGLALLAVALVAAGQLLAGGEGGRIAVPIDPRSAPPATAPIASTTIVTAPIGLTLAPPPEVVTVDPFGSNEENDQNLPALTDGDSTSTWRSERYRDQLSLIKPGLGLGFKAVGAPLELVIEGITTGVSYEIGWSPSPTIDSLEHVGRGVNRAGTVAIQLPRRQDGWWILWVTEIPADATGERSFEVAEVRFGS
jgi:hypothetical protein